MSSQDPDRYLKAFDLGGHLLVIEKVIEDEKQDKMLTASKIKENPEAAYLAIAESVMSIYRDVFRGLITRNVLQDHLIPKIGAVTGPDLEYQNGGKQVLQQILDTKIVQDDIRYLVKWRGGFWDGRVSWDPLGVLLDKDENVTCQNRPNTFHAANPDKPRHGCTSLSKKKLLPLLETEWIIYAHFLVNTSSQAMYQAPSTDDLDKISDGMRYYYNEMEGCSEKEIEEHRAFVYKVDNPDEKFRLSSSNWKPEYNERRLKKHAQVGPKNPELSKERLKQYRTLLFPALEAAIERVPHADRHLPHPRPLSEVGLTKNPISRMKDHRSHSGTTVGLAFIECISIALFGGKYRWIYQVIAQARKPISLPILEGFFSRLCKAYFWLGGANVDEAGKSLRAVYDFNVVQESAAADRTDFTTFHANLDWTNRRIKLIEYVATKGERAQVSRELKEVTDEIKKLNKEYREHIFDTLENFVSVLKRHQEMMEEDLKARQSLRRVEEMIRIEDRLRKLSMGKK